MYYGRYVWGGMPSIAEFSRLTELPILCNMILVCSCQCSVALCWVADVLSVNTSCPILGRHSVFWSKYTCYSVKAAVCVW